MKSKSAGVYRLWDCSDRAVAVRFAKAASAMHATSAVVLPGTGVEGKFVLSQIPDWHPAAQNAYHAYATAGSERFWSELSRSELLEAVMCAGDPEYSSEPYIFYDGSSWTVIRGQRRIPNKSADLEDEELSTLEEERMLERELLRSEFDFSQEQVEFYRRGRDGYPLPSQEFWSAVELPDDYLGGGASTPEMTEFVDMAVLGRELLKSPSLGDQYPFPGCLGPRAFNTDFLSFLVLLCYRRSGVLAALMAFRELEAIEPLDWVLFGAYRLGGVNISISRVCSDEECVDFAYKLVLSCWPGARLGDTGEWLISVPGGKIESITLQSRAIA